MTRGKCCNAASSLQIRLTYSTYFFFIWAKRYQQSVELPFDEMKSIAESIGFNFQREEWKETTYNSNCTSMMRTVYDCAFFTAVKPTKS
jgi:hypothetical protein